jgi:acyl carrier protein
MVSHLAGVLEIDADKIDVRKPFKQFGLGSIEGVGMVADLEDWLGISMDASLIWDYPTIASFAEYLANEVNA